MGHASCDALTGWPGACRTPVETATSKTIAATFEKERYADDDRDRDEAPVARRVSVRKRRTLAPSKERRDA
jgi:hypothetical protein